MYVTLHLSLDSINCGLVSRITENISGEAFLQWFAEAILLIIECRLESRLGYQLCQLL